MDELIKLKAYAYDLIAKMEFCQNELSKVNQKISELGKQDDSDSQEKKPNKFTCGSI